MKIKVRSDKSKSNSLKKMAEITLERLNKTNMEKYPTNSLIDYYDIIHKLMESFSLSKGVKIKGEGAHQELIEYVSKEIPFNEQTKRFLQQMRIYRNRIAYEGFNINENYIIENKKRILNIIGKLFEKLE